MKPKTKIQQEIFALSNKLPNLKERMQKWTFENVIEHRAYRTKTKTSCLSCGHVWKGQPEVIKEKCPICKRTLIITDSLKKKDKQMVYTAFLDTKDRFQVNRFFQMYTYNKSGQKPNVFFWEIAQQWLDPDGKSGVVARNRAGMGYYSSDNWHGDLEIRDRGYLGSKYNVWVDAIHPKMRLLPLYQRNGLTPDIQSCEPLLVMEAIATDSMAETLIKTKQFALLNTRIARPERVKEYWNSVKICIRNNYIVSSGTTWLDYLDLLVHFGKDVLSPKYICPIDLKRAHNRLVDKKRSIERREEVAKLKARIKEANIRYRKEKKAFFGLMFQDGDLMVKVLENVNEFLKEGDAHKHCVFTNSYFNKPDSLVFSAQIDGNPVETVEVSLSKMKLLQARGLGNEPTAHHQRIINLVNRNLKAIKDRSKKLRKEVA